MLKGLDDTTTATGVDKLDDTTTALIPLTARWDDLKLMFEAHTLDAWKGRRIINTWDCFHNKYMILYGFQLFVY